MSKMKLLAAGIILLLLINIALVAFVILRKPAEERLGPSHPREGGPKSLIIKKLHFDKQQVSDYESLVEQHRSDVRGLDRQIREAKNELYSTLVNGNVQMKDSMQNVLSALHKEIELVHYNHFSDIKKLCKPDQQEYFNSLAKELAELFSRRKNMPPPTGD